MRKVRIQSTARQNNMSEFKIGDLVVKKSGVYFESGRTIRISKLRRDGRYEVGGEGYIAIYNHDALELAQPKYPNPPRPHADVIIEWAKGADIDVRIDYDGQWYLDLNPTFIPQYGYRVVPNPSELADIKTQAKIDKHQAKIDALKLTLSNWSK